MLRVFDYENSAFAVPFWKFKQFLDDAVSCACKKDSSATRGRAVIYYPVLYQNSMSMLELLSCAGSAFSL